MEDLSKQISELQAAVQAAVTKLAIDEKVQQLRQLDDQSQQPDFWQDNLAAQKVMKERSVLEQAVQPWQDLQAMIKDVQELIGTGDASLQADLTQQMAMAQATFDGLKQQLKFNGPYDERSAILSIHAGAGGTDAQDWAQMLLRMYTRWAEKNDFKVSMFDESAGEEAGIKSATISIEGSYAYGKLQGEHGVHRLVRLSPFNADNLRQTSFAKVEVLPELDTPDSLQIDDKDLKIDVYRSGGHGGQSVNTTDSAVRITHIPTGITVAIQNERSQLQNKETALTILRSRLAQLQLEQHAADLQAIKGPNEQAAWGNQIRNYVLHPYKQVKDVRTGCETSDPDKVLDGELNSFIDSFLESQLA